MKNDGKDDAYHCKIDDQMCIVNHHTEKIWQNVCVFTMFLVVGREKCLPPSSPINIIASSSTALNYIIA